LVLSPEKNLSDGKNLSSSNQISRDKAKLHKINLAEKRRTQNCGFAYTLIGERRKRKTRKRQREKESSAEICLRNFITNVFARIMNNLRVNAVVINLDEPTMVLRAIKRSHVKSQSVQLIHIRAFGLFNDVRQTSCGLHTKFPG